MARQITTINAGPSVPDFLLRVVDARKLKDSKGLDYEAYRACRERGRVPMRLASRYMGLVHQGMGTYTDSAGTAWYRDGQTIVRVTDDLDWIDRKAEQKLPKRKAQTQLKDNTENTETQTSLPSSSGDYELPQGEHRFIRRKRRQR